MRKPVRRAVAGVVAAGVLGISAACAGQAALSEYVLGTWQCTVRFPAETVAATVEVGEGTYTLTTADGDFSDAGTWQVEGDGVTITSGEIDGLRVLGVPEQRQDEPLSIDIVRASEDEPASSDVTITDDTVGFAYNENSYTCVKQDEGEGEA
ncbi:hypothetical protein LG943_26060 [Streptomonospora sp. S1-112]|uniref:Lipocalin-like domain-containing protein n=1 Tax=Streptomonospora mangrovi TaxID=2883123 RepID=A0A9X3NRC1_9ACTN|nr:hypothetical protein [Streptomonospora mangrovi]MDA0567760.1 hypothetical protein [Streptomonospora mangrovi]